MTLPPLNSPAPLEDPKVILFQASVSHSLCFHLLPPACRDAAPTPPPISPSGMPEEDAYSDDIDYLGELIIPFILFEFIYCQLSLFTVN